MVSVENINHQKSFLKNIVKGGQTIENRIEDLFFPIKKQPEQENIAYLKSFWAGTGIVEKLEKIKNDKDIVYEKTEKGRRTEIDLIHIVYKKNTEENKEEIEVIFDHKQHQGTLRDYEFYRKISIKTWNVCLDEIKVRKIVFFSLEYEDTRHEEDNFSKHSNKYEEIIENIDRAIDLRNKEENKRIS